MLVVCFIACDSSFSLLCSLLSFIVVHYARDCSCMYMYMYMYLQWPQQLRAYFSEPTTSHVHVLALSRPLQSAAVRWLRDSSLLSCPHHLLLPPDLPLLPAEPPGAAGAADRGRRWDWGGRGGGYAFIQYVCIVHCTRIYVHVHIYVCANVHVHVYMHGSLNILPSFSSCTLLSCVYMELLVMYSCICHVHVHVCNFMHGSTYMYTMKRFRNICREL